ncbi:Rho GTPase activation protein, partial [Fennellomyces sp. T-0311]
FQDEYKRSITTSKQSVDAALKQFDGLVKEMDRAKIAYQKRWREAEESAKEEMPKEESNEMILIGNQRMSRGELNTLVNKMQSEIKVGDYRVPIIGRYQNTSTGEDISIWLQQNMPQCKDSPAMADVVAQQLIHPLGVLRLVGQRGNKFSPSPQSYYQWQQLPQPQQQDQQQDEMADEAYRTAVKKIDQMRMVVEQALFAHFSEMEQVELRRLAVLKQAIASFSLCISEMLPGDKAIVDEMLVYQESLKPEQDIQYIVQHYCVSSFSPKPILYENQDHGVSRDQIFGVRLDDLGKMTDDKVPKFVQCLLDAIDKGKTDKHRLWSTRLPLDRIHAICADLNIPSEQVTTELLQQHEPMTLVAILRLYLLDLPECLMTFEFYDAVQALYAVNDTLRLSPLSNLIATLPATHFATLRSLLSHIKKVVQQDDVQAISDSLGPVILRPRTESLTTLTSSLPIQFVQDLVNHYDTLFSEATLKSHAESEKRRQARPLVATNYPLPSTNNEANTTSDKWMGVFQRNNSMSSASTSSSSEPRSSFTRPTPPIPITAITQGSPPSSPKELPKKELPAEKEVEKEKEKEKEPTVTKEVVFDIEAHNDDGELDPFFDDD